MLEPAASATDWGIAGIAIAGMVSVLVARSPRESAFWLLALLAIAMSAGLGAVYHGWLKSSAVWSGPVWAAVTWCLAAMLTFILAGTSRVAADPGRANLWTTIQVASLALFTVAILLGLASISTLLWLESVAMAAILLLWLRGVRRKLPGSRAILLAAGLSGAAALFRLLPIEFRLGWDWDPESLYHIAQVPGLVAFVAAIHQVVPGPRTASIRPRLLRQRARSAVHGLRLRPPHRSRAEERP